MQLYRNHKRFKNPEEWFAKMKEKGIVVSPNVKPRNAPGSSVSGGYEEKRICLYMTA